MSLKACPCGEVPDRLGISSDGSSKWAYATCNKCGEWSIEFRTEYHPVDSDECQKLAAEAWNKARRGEQ